MKILICTFEYPPEASGIGNFAFNIVNEFKKRGHECTTCSIIGDADIKLGKVKLLKLFGGLAIMDYWIRINQYFKRSKYDSVWLHSPLLVSRLPFPNAVLTMHTTYAGFYKMSRQLKYPIHIQIFYYLMQRLETHVLSQLALYQITYVSDSIKSELDEMGIRTDQQILVLPGVDTNRFKPVKDKSLIRNKFDVPCDKLVFLYVGRLEGQKRIPALINIMLELKNTLPHLQLIIVGDGQYKDTVNQLASGHDEIRYFGYVSSDILPDIYAMSDLFMMTSEYEGQPAAIMEAMASGLPPILSNIPVFENIIESSNSGIILDSMGPITAAAQIKDYILNSNMDDESRKARIYANENLGLAICAERILDLLHRNAITYI